MDIFGIGPMELIVILILLLLVFGPNRLPVMGARLGRALRDMRESTREFSREVAETRDALVEPFEDVRADRKSVV